MRIDQDTIRDLDREIDQYLAHRGLYDPTSREQRYEALQRIVSLAFNAAMNEIKTQVAIKGINSQTLDLL